jgi:hypothetical protein
MRKLNLVVGEDAQGDVVVLYAGRDAVEAKNALDDAVTAGQLVEVVHLRNPQPVRRKRPRKIAEAIATDAAEAAAEPEEAPEKKGRKK